MCYSRCLNARESALEECIRNLARGPTVAEYRKQSRGRSTRPSSHSAKASPLPPTHSTTLPRHVFNAISLRLRASCYIPSSAAAIIPMKRCLVISAGIMHAHSLTSHVETHDSLLNFDLAIRAAETGRLCVIPLQVVLGCIPGYCLPFGRTPLPYVCSPTSGEFNILG